MSFKIIKNAIITTLVITSIIVLMVIFSSAFVVMWIEHGVVGVLLCVLAVFVMSIGANWLDDNGMMDIFSDNTLNVGDNVIITGGSCFEDYKHYIGKKCTIYKIEDDGYRIYKLAYEGEKLPYIFTEYIISKVK